MSYDEKCVWVYLLSTVGSYAVYLVIVLGRAAHTPITHVHYATALLLAIGVSIGLSIVATIAFEVVKPSDSRRSDVRDKEIKRFGEYVSRWFVILAAAAAFGMALLRWDYFWIANVIYLGFVLWAVVGSVVKLVAYRRGLS
jgi:hypothetical protein